MTSFFCAWSRATVLAWFIGGSVMLAVEVAYQPPRAHNRHEYAVWFDLDGVLVEFDGWKEGAKRSVSFLPYPRLTFKLYRGSRAGGEGLAHKLRALCYHENEEIGKVFDEILAQKTLIPGIAEVVQAVVDAGFVVCIATNQSKLEVDMLKEKYEEFFALIKGPIITVEYDVDGEAVQKDGVPDQKPHDPYYARMKAAAKERGFKYNIFFDDKEPNVHGALKAGIKAYRHANGKPANIRQRLETIGILPKALPQVAKVQGQPRAQGVKRA